MQTMKCVAFSLLQLFILSQFACALYAQSDLHPVLQKAVEAERNLPPFEVEVDRQEFSMLVSRGIKSAVSTSTKYVQSKAVLRKKISYTLTKQKANQKRLGVNVRNVVFPKAAQQSSTQRPTENPAKPTTILTVSADVLFGHLDPKKTRVEALQETASTITLKIENEHLSKLGPIYLRATFEKATGLLLKSELNSHGVPVLVTTFDYRKGQSNQRFLVQRTIRMNSENSVWVSVEKFGLYKFFPNSAEK